MEQDKLLQLVLRLGEKTSQNEVAWTKTTETNTFLASFRDFSVLVNEHFSGDYQDELDYSFMILNRDGDVVERVLSADLYNFNQARKERYNVNFREKLKQLFSNARRRALGIDDAIDSILEQLGDDTDKIPF